MQKWTQYWICYFFVVAIFLLFACFSWGKDWDMVLIQLGGLVVTITAMLMIMLQNNETIEKTTTEQITIHTKNTEQHITALYESTKQQLLKLEEINKLSNQQLQALTQQQIEALNTNTEKQIENFKLSSQKQIDSFVEQTQGIISRLEDVSEELLQLYKVNEQMLEHEKERIKYDAEKTQQRYEELQLQKGLLIDEINRHKPEMFFRLETGIYWLMKHYYIYLYNKGGAVNSIILNISFQSSYNNSSSSVHKSVFRKLDSLSQEKIRVGRASNYNNFDKIVLQLQSRDIDNRLYNSEMIFNKIEDQWIEIVMEDDSSIKYLK